MHGIPKAPSPCTATQSHSSRNILTTKSLIAVQNQRPRRVYCVRPPGIRRAYSTRILTVITLIPLRTTRFNIGNAMQYLYGSAHRHCRQYADLDLRVRRKHQLHCLLSCPPVCLPRPQRRGSRDLASITTRRAVQPVAC